jgi:hypothetical protein
MSTSVHACHTRDYEANVHILKLQLLQNRILRAIGSYDRRTPVREIQMAFKIAYVDYYVIKFCRKLAPVIQNHLNANVHGNWTWNHP